MKGTIKVLSPKIGLHKKLELGKKAVNLFQDYQNRNVFYTKLLSSL